MCQWKALLMSYEAKVYNVMMALGFLNDAAQPAFISSGAEVKGAQRQGR